MKEIPLTKGMVALVDDEDYEKVSQYKWHYNKKNNAFRYGVLISKTHRRKSIEILTRFLYPFNKTTTDIQHIDGNKLNYTRDNLVFLTKSEHFQGQNFKQSKPCSSVFVGVTWAAKLKKWIAQISYNNKMVYLGLFPKELEAAAAYNKKAIELYGPNAKLNPLPLEEN